MRISPVGRVPYVRHVNYDRPIKKEEKTENTTNNEINNDVAYEVEITGNQQVNVNHVYGPDGKMK